jgi:hypothetical protein
MYVYFPLLLRVYFPLGAVPAVCSVLWLIWVVLFWFWFLLFFCVLVSRSAVVYFPLLLRVFCSAVLVLQLCSFLLVVFLYLVLVLLVLVQINNICYYKK